MPRNHSTATAKNPRNQSARITQSLPPMIVNVIRNQAIIYSGYQSHTLQLPACILEVAPIIEAAFPEWWKTSQADRVRAIVFGLTKKHHIKGLHIIDPVPSRTLQRHSIIRLVKPADTPRST